MNLYMKYFSVACNGHHKYWESSQIVLPRFLRHNISAYCALCLSFGTINKHVHTISTLTPVKQVTQVNVSVSQTLKAILSASGESCTTGFDILLNDTTHFYFFSKPKTIIPPTICFLPHTFLWTCQGLFHKQKRLLVFFFFAVLTFLPSVGKKLH